MSYDNPTHSDISSAIDSAKRDLTYDYERADQQLRDDINEHQRNIDGLSGRINDLGTIIEEMSERLQTRINELNQEIEGLKKSLQNPKK